MTEHDDEKSEGLPLLRSLLPPGYAAAQRELDKVFELAARDGREDAHGAALHRWMSTLLKAEYFDELPGGAESPASGEADAPR
jgi:hypothetical protein